MIYCFSEDAVEYNELDQFLRLKDEYDPSIEDERPLLPQEVIGVPGAVLPAEMTPEQHKTKIYAETSPLAKVKGKSKPVNKEGNVTVDVGSELEGFGLQGVKVTEEELLSLVEELGLGGEEADELVKGLGIGEKKEGKPKETSNPPSVKASEEEKEKKYKSTEDAKTTESSTKSTPHHQE
jgi:SH3 domain-binding glutamic acid-rich protein